MRFSWAPRHTTGSDVLTGCLGIVWAESYTLNRLMAEWDEKHHPVLTSLTKTTLSITAHYHTEPPQVNFVSVTSFFNPIHPSDDLVRGGILGLDLLKPEEGYARHALVPDVEFKERVVPVYDLSPILTVTRTYLDRFPFYPGCRVFEANTEISTFTCEEKAREQVRQGKAVRLYAVLAIGIPKGNACRLLMEDKGYLLDEEEEQRKVLVRAARSILACEAVEQERGVPVEYQHIYLLTTFSEPLAVDQEDRFGERQGFVPAWSQVQFMYANPPQEMVPPERAFEDLKAMPFEEWLVGFPD